MKVKSAHHLVIIPLTLFLVSCNPVSESAEAPPTQFLTEETTATSPAPMTTEERGSKYNESPMLAKEVMAGNLPPVDERLPKNPRVLPVYEQIGQYGGTWRRAYAGLGDKWGPTKLIEERIIEFYMTDSGTISIVPNWADQFDANADATEFTAHIREGLRWSDGVNVTTEDVRFWYEDVFLDKRFIETFPSKLVSAGQPMELEIIDQYTFKLRFAESYPLFPTSVAGGVLGPFGLQGTSFLMPSHYLKDFHPNYTSEDELERISDSYGVDSWLDLWHFGPVQAWWLNPDLPVLAAWKIKIPPPAERIVMERNPYYHAVDSAGNQLPYIDEITHDLFDVSETMSLWVLQGLIDLQSRHVTEDNYTLYKRNESQGNYHITTWTGGDTLALYLNQNTTDETLAKLFADIRFRQALSVGIDRNEINEFFYNGLGESRQASPTTGSPNFDSEFEKKWVEYDPEKANALLDEMGLVIRNSDGFRQALDGKDLELEISTTSFSISQGTLGLVQDFWEEIGIKVQINQIERLDYEELAEAGNIDIGIWPFDRSVIISSDPGRYLGTITDGPWAPLYGQWYGSDSQKGVEPPIDHPIWQVWDAWEKAKSATTEEEAHAFIQEMISVHKENVWIIGLVGEQPRLYIVNDNVQNFPDELPNDDTLREIGLAQPAQFFFTQP